MRALLAVAALVVLACGAASAQTVVVGPNGVAVYDRHGSGYAVGDDYTGPVRQYHGGRGDHWQDRARRDHSWRDHSWRDHSRRAERGDKRGHHDDDWKRRGYQSGYGYGDARHDGYRDCRRVERRDWVNGRRVIISEVICFDRWGNGQLQRGSAVLRDCPDYYRGW